jgi:hypothetical protein
MKIVAFRRHRGGNDPVERTNAMSQHEIEFLVRGEITWVNKSGTKEVHKRVQAGNRLVVRVNQQEDGYYTLTDSGYSVVIPSDNIRIID